MSGYDEHLHLRAPRVTRNRIVALAESRGITESEAHRNALDRGLRVLEREARRKQQP